MQYVVPQFIDVEDKIFGPISVRQFVTLLVGTALIFANYQLVYKFFIPNFWFFAISSIGIFAISGTFAFLRINGRPFHHFLLNLLVTMQKPRLRIWNKKLTREELTVKEEEIILPAPLPTKKPLSPRKLTELSLVVDTGGAYHEEVPEQPEAEKAATGRTPVKDIFSEE